MVNFNFATAQRIIFGPGRVSELGGLAAQYGRQACLITGGQSMETSGQLGRIERLLGGAGLSWIQMRITQEPTVEAVDAAAEKAREFKAEMVIAIGGGSVLDTGKAVAALLTNGGQTIDYLEGVGRGKTLDKASLPCLAVPTTAGTGSEATKNAVISDAGRTFKKSLRSDWMLPAMALVDPELTAGCPAQVAAACGMDALTQLIEAFTSQRASPMIDALAGLGLGMAAHLPKLAGGEMGGDTREALALASLLGGIALANAGLGAVHGLASPLGAFYPVPHGVVCAALLAPVVAANARRAAAEGNRLLLQKYIAVTIQLLETNRGEQIPEIPFEALAPGAGQDGDKALEVALSLAGFLKALREHLGVPGLGKFGVKAEDFGRIIDGARGGSMKTNAVTLGDEELARVLEEAL